MHNLIDFRYSNECKVTLSSLDFFNEHARSKSTREYVARAKGLARAVEYHDLDVAEEKNCRKSLNDLPSSTHFVREVVALRYKFSLVELE